MKSRRPSESSNHLKRRFRVGEKVRFRLPSSTDDSWETGQISSDFNVTSDWFSMRDNGHGHLRSVPMLVPDPEEIQSLSNVAYEEILYNEFHRSVTRCEVDSITWCDRGTWGWSYHIIHGTRPHRQFFMTCALARKMAASLRQCSHHGVKLAHLFGPAPTFPVLVEALTSSRDLETLGVSRCKTDAIDEAIAIVSEKKCVQKLVLSSCLIPALEGCASFLHELHLDSCSFRDDGGASSSLGPFFRAQKQFEQPPLKKLVWGVGYAGDLVDLLCQCDFLENLELSKQYSDEEALSVARLLRESQALKTLKLCFFSSSKSKLEIIVSEMQSNTSLNVLVLEDRDGEKWCTVDKAQILAGHLMHFTGLRHIDLRKIFQPDNDATFETLWTDIEKMHPSMVEKLTWDESNTSREMKDKVNLFCRVHARLNRHIPSLFKNGLSKVPLFLLPEVLASVSLKPYGIYDLLNTYPDMVPPRNVSKRKKVAVG